MSLETAMENLAVAMTRYSEVAEKYGLKIEGANKAPAAEDEKPAKDKPAAAAKGKAATKPAPADDDGFESDKPPAKKAKKLTHDDVKAKLLEVKEAAGDKGPAIAIIEEYGYAGIPAIKDKDFEAIFADAEKWLEDNQ